MTQTTANTTNPNTVSTSNIRYVVFSNTAGLTEYVEGVIASAKTLRDKIQIAAVGTLIHIGKHGDTDTGCRLASKMINELKGVQVKALADWFLMFGAVLSDDGKSFGGWDIDTLKARFNGGADVPKSIKGGAKQTHWVTFVPANPWAGFDLDSKLTSLLNQAEAAQKRASENTEEASVVSIIEPKVDLLTIINALSEEQCLEMLSAVRPAQESVEGSSESSEMFVA